MADTPNIAGDGAGTVSDLADLKVLTGGEPAPPAAAPAPDASVAEGEEGSAPPPPPPSYLGSVTLPAIEAAVAAL